MRTVTRRTATLVDQHPLWLEQVEQVVQRAEVDVVAKIASSAVAQDRLAELRPELVVTGLKMSDGEPDGFTLIRYIRETLPETKIVVLSMYDDAEHIEGAFAAGADAYVLKTSHPDDIVSAVRQAFQHSIYLAGARIAPTVPAPAVDESAGLTRRELEILQLVAEGHSNAQLARMLWVTEQTVKFHLSNIYRKLDVANRTEASRWAQVKGLLQAPSAMPIAS
jgi:DNA-binding NarL/FixJ family response regulator